MFKVKYILAILGIIGIAYLIPKLVSEYETKEEEEFNMSSIVIWVFINDLNNIPKRLPKIKNIKIIDSSATGVNFRLETHDNDWLSLRSSITSDTTRILEFLETSFGYKGRWEYTLRDNGDETCKLFINEKSKLESFGWRIFFLLIGRDAILREEFRGLKFMAKEDM